jgi:hypothetical protein
MGKIVQFKIMGDKIVCLTEDNKLFLGIYNDVTTGVWEWKEINLDNK